MPVAQGSNIWIRQFGRTAASVAFMALTFWSAGPVRAEPSIIAPGDAVVTGFSGTKTDKDVPKTVHPLDRTFIDADGVSVRVLDLTDLGTPPDGQLAETPVRLEIKAKDVGQVFGVALDNADAPNAYVSATSLYGLQIVNKADGERLVDGAAGAEWMPGQFGPLGPGGIYRIDGRNGAITPFATIKAGSRENSGAALGNITFDAATRQLFVSDLETGLIHAIGLDGKSRGSFDHGVAARTAQGLDTVPGNDGGRVSIASDKFSSEDPATWGYADPRRRVFGLSIFEGRLYYAVAEGPSIWSVSLSENGRFGNDPRIETDVRGGKPNLDITDIAFDGRGHMIVSQRGATLGSYEYAKFAEPQQASVLRYVWDDAAGRWSEATEEYALGLKSDHRATQGGVAISYGYDAYGKLDRAQCRQTLWTTGERLRETAETSRTSSGGPRLVSGLQGNQLASVRPQNAPPLEAWFTDNDGQFDDVAAYGHIGDVAIYAPCSDAIERAEAPPPPLAPLPLSKPDLAIAKSCDGGAIGGKIKCTISVSNISGAPLKDAAKLVDVTKTLHGPGAGALVPVSSYFSLAPGLLCSPTPTSDFTCVIPAALLGPGNIVAIDVFVDTAALVLAGNLGFRNCATVQHPSGHAKACAEGGTDLIVEKIGPGECQPGGTCKFGLKLANAGLMPFAGDVILADAMFVGGAVQNAPVTAVNPPIPCTLGNTNQLPFTCVTPIALMPGEEKIHWIEVTMPAPGGYWAENCFGALDPALLPGLPPVPPFGGGGGAGNPSCVWVHVPVPQPNLKLTKTAQNGGLCNKVGADLECDYTIEVRNQDAVAFNGPITVQETMPAGGVLSNVSAPWACAGVPPAYACSTGAAVNIPPGGTVAFNVRIKQSVVDSEANMCKVPNKAKISVPAGGVAPNIDATDDEATAQAMTLGIAWEDPITGITFVMCDPTNLKVEKTADGPCDEASGGFMCGYDVTITNEGPDPYKGPIKLEEKFGITPASVSFSGDLDCAGGGASFTCQKAEAHIAVGASLNVRVEAKVKDDGTCEAPNTATLVSPPENARGNTDGSDDSASATAEIQSRKCKRTPPVTEATCPDGKPIPKNGRCPCPGDTTWNRQTLSCEGDDIVVTDGCVPGRYEVKIEDGRCVCAEGYVRNGRGRCIPDDGDDCGPDAYLDTQSDRCVPYDDEPPYCGPREYMTMDGFCKCRPGLIRIGGICSSLVGIPLPPVWRDCPPGYAGNYPNCRRIPRKCPVGYSGYYPYCRLIVPDPPKACPPNSYPIGKRCECRPGFERRGDLTCVPVRPQPCPPGTSGLYPNCKPIGGPGQQCPDGQVGKWPNCRPIIRPCPPQTIGTWPNCKPMTNVPPGPQVCPPGTVGKWPRCKQENTVPPVVQPPVKPPVVQVCPPGTVGNWPNCKSRPVVQPPKVCPSGMVGVPPNCIPRVKPNFQNKPVKPPKLDIKPPKPNFNPGIKPKPNLQVPGGITIKPQKQNPGNPFVPGNQGQRPKLFN